MKKLLTVVALSSALIVSAGAMASCSNEKLEMGKECMKYGKQLEALTQLKSGSVDAVVIDSVMAGYYATTGDFAGKVAVVDNLVLAEESYGIAGRKEDKAFMSKINETLITLYNEGTVNTIAAQFGLTETLALSASTTNPLAGATDDSWTEIQTAGKIIVGYTEFAPIAYYADDGSFTGFDTELAKAVAEELDVEVEFQVIDWDSKESLLANGTIDLIWNGLTITPGRSAEMCISVPYLYNKQVAVVLTENVSKYSDKESFKDAVIGVESGSAGEEVVTGKKSE